MFGAETWVLTETISQQLEGAHGSFFRQVTRKQETRRRVGSGRQVPVESVLQGAGIQTISTYVSRRKATVV